MNLDDFIITCFCMIDEMLPSVTQGKRLRERGPMPKLADSEVITMELVGTYLGLSQDQEVFDYFRRHYRISFPQWPRWLARLLCARPPTCGRSKSGCGV